jgi:hypothetical protein
VNLLTRKMEISWARGSIRRSGERCRMRVGGCLG